MAVALVQPAEGERVTKVQGSLPAAEGRALSEHVLASAPEYNRLDAHPFAWTWTNQKMRQRFARHAS
jgi:hypothetical protein